MTDGLPDGVSIFARGLPHAEGIAFDSQGGIYTGIARPDHLGHGPLVHVSPDGNSIREVADTGGRILGIATDELDRAYVCDSQIGAVLRIDPRGNITSVLERVGGRELMMPNFCTFDPNGVLYVADSGTATAGETTGAVYRRFPNGRSEIVVDGLVFANGLAHDPRTDALYVVETRDDRVLRIDMGGPGAPTTEVYAENLRTGPDGLALDARGTLYVTITRAHAIVEATDRGSRTVMADPTGTWLNTPSNLAFFPDGAPTALVANLFGHHLTRLDMPSGGSRPVQGPAS